MIKALGPLQVTQKITKILSGDFACFAYVCNVPVQIGSRPCEQLSTGPKPEIGREDMRGLALKAKTTFFNFILVKSGYTIAKLSNLSIYLLH